MPKDHEADVLKDEKKIPKRREKVIQTKIVVRRLPPSMTEEAFKEKFDPLPEQDFFRFVHGDRTLAPHNYCRAYINFVKPEDINPFVYDYDGMLIENKGQKSVCVVEYAPFQKTSRRNRTKKVDSKAGTILEDPDFLAFNESLQTVVEKESLNIEQYLIDLEGREKKADIVETPLTTYIKQKREEKKVRSERLREDRRKLELDRKKKREEERRKKKEADKKKREATKSKKSESASRSDYDRKKTLAETRPSGGKHSDGKDEEGSKVKILQKEKESSRFTAKVDKPREAPPRYKNSRDRENTSSSVPSSASSRSKTSSWKSDPHHHGSSGKNDDGPAEAKVKSKEFKSRSYNNSRAGGFHRGSGSRGGGGGGGNTEVPPAKNAPQKYSEQRSTRAGGGGGSSRRNESSGK